MYLIYLPNLNALRWMKHKKYFSKYPLKNLFFMPKTNPYIPNIKACIRCVELGTWYTKLVPHVVRSIIYYEYEVNLHTNKYGIYWRLQNIFCTTPPPPNLPHQWSWSRYVDQEEVRFRQQYLHTFFCGNICIQFFFFFFSTSLISLTFLYYFDYLSLQLSTISII